MIQKTYKTGTLSEAIAAVKQEMGSHAVIVSTKKMLSKGLFPLKPRPSIEVLAAVDENYLSIEQLTSLQKDPTAKAVPMALESDKANQGVNVSVSPGAERRRLLERISELEAEVSRLKNLLGKQEGSNLTSEVASTDEENVLQVPVQAAPPVAAPEQKAFEAQETITEYAAFLKNSGLSAELTEGWLAKAAGKTFQSAGDVFEACADYVAAVFSPYRGVLPRMIALVGASEAGKTTTAVKLAHFLKQSGKSVGLVSFDVKDEAAVARLKAESGEMGIPFAAIHNNHTVEMRLRNMSECDHILMDTPSWDTDSLLWQRTRKKLLQAGALSLVVVPADKPEFSVLPEELKAIGAVYTKLDACFKPGLLVNHMKAAALPVAYYGIGPHGGDDLEAASAERLLALLFNIQENNNA